MQTSLKNVTERAQKCDFSVNIPIYIAYNKLTFCVRKLTLTRHCVFPLNLGLKKTFQLKNAH